MKTVHCEECKHFEFPNEIDEHAYCGLGHNVRFYKPKSIGYMDSDYGWKKKCEDFKMSKRVKIIELKGKNGKDGE